ncbi:MAG: ATP-binding protein [Chloroflexota bacterium]
MADSERKLRLSGKIEQVRKACDFIVTVTEEAGFDEKSVFQSQLAVEEIFTNIVEHGYKHKGADKTIDIITLLSTDKLIIKILDDAPLFNPLTLDEPDPKASLWDRKGGGWGVYFVRQYMDDVRYKLYGNRNSIILEKLRPKSS